MRINNVCVIGGSGFVGSHVCRELAARGIRVVVPTRDRERAKALILLPTVEVVEADVHDPAALARVAAGCDAVINLVGVLHDGRGKGSFRAAHIELARNAVEACRVAGVTRLLHMSALGAAPDGPSAYLRSKGEAERIVRDSGLEWTIFRPSVIFGPEDSFLNLFARILSVLRLLRIPVFPLGSPEAQFQPVFAGDVATAFVRALDDVRSRGCSYDLCGPMRYSLRELVIWTGRITGCQRPVIGLGKGLSYFQALVMELWPRKMITRDNVRSMEIDSVCDCVFPFGIQPRALEVTAPAWLAGDTPRARYDQLRSRAGR